MSENRRRRNNGAQNRQVKKARTNNARRILLLVGLMSLVAVISIGGTIAWLTDSTEEVTNTFTTADVDIALTETWNTDTDNDGTNDSWQAQLIPGKVYSKNPKVEVLGTTDVDVYLFVKFEEDAKDYLDYTSTLTVANGWTQGDGTNIPSSVWYRTVAKDADTKSWELLADNKVTVKTSIVKKGTDVAGTNNIAMPSGNTTLRYTAYAIQTEGFDTVKEAWDTINPSTGS